MDVGTWAGIGAGAVAGVVSVGTVIWKAGVIHADIQSMRTGMDEFKNSIRQDMDAFKTSIGDSTKRLDQAMEKLADVAYNHHGRIVALEQKVTPTKQGS